MQSSEDEAFLAAAGLGARLSGTTERSPIEYDAFLAHRTVSRVGRDVIVGDERTRVELVEKRTEGPALASPYLHVNARRELLAYRSGMLTALPSGLRAPRLAASAVDADGAITLWLEPLEHDRPRPLDAESLLLAASALGALGGSWLERDANEEWLFTGWIDRHSQPEAIEPGLAALSSTEPAVVARFGERLALARRLALEQRAVREVVESLPQTICHHDAVGANVYLHGPTTSLIDWESVGPGAIGADLASLLFASVRRGDADITTVVGILPDAIEAYADGARAVAPHLTHETVELGFHASVALRWKLAADLASSIATGRPSRRGSRPDEDPAEAQHELSRLLDLLLDSARAVLS